MTESSFFVLGVLGSGIELLVDLSSFEITDLSLDLDG